MDKTIWVTIGSAIASLVTLGFTALNLRLGAKKEELQSLEGKIEKMESDLHDCERKCKELLEENLLLLRKLTKD